MINGTGFITFENKCLYTLSFPIFEINNKKSKLMNIECDETGIFKNNNFILKNTLHNYGKYYGIYNLDNKCLSKAPHTSLLPTTFCIIFLSLETEKLLIKLIVKKDYNLEFEYDGNIFVENDIFYILNFVIQFTDIKKFFLNT